MQGREFWKLIGLAVLVGLVVGGVTGLIGALLGFRSAPIGGAAGAAVAAVVITARRRRQNR